MEIPKIAPVGTCRIHTPLRRGTSRYPFHLVLTRNYGFVHTSKEVLQQLDLLLGGDPVPQALWPLIYRPNTTEEFINCPAILADLYFFEISSAKDVTIDGLPIQINYVKRHFSDFFADKEVARRFWSAARAGTTEQHGDWLETIPAFQRLCQEERELLSAIRMRELDPAEVAADMAAIVERVGRDKAVFITHVNANTPDDQPIASRARLIDIVTRASKDLGVRCYDPTAAMNAFGQLNAMEQDGLDLTHFTLPFADRLSADWFGKYIEPLLPAHYASERGAEPDAPADIGRMQEMLDAGDIVAVSRQVWKSIHAGEGGDAHHRLAGRASFALGDYERAVAILERVRSLGGAVEEDDMMLMEAHFTLENHRQALTYGRSLMSDERETENILTTSAAAAEKLGLDEEALTYWKRLLLSDMQNSRAASAMLAIFLRLQDHDAVFEWADHILAAMPAHTDSLKAKWHVHLARRDILDLIALADRCEPLPDDEIFALTRDTVAAGLALPAAVLIAPRLGRAGASAAMTEWAEQQGQEWRDKGLKALDAGDLVLAADLIQASVRLAPKARASIRAKRVLDQDMRDKIRKAFSAKKHQQVLDLADIALQNAVTFPGFDSIIGRAAAALGNYTKALYHLRQALAAKPSAAMRLQFARVAVKARDYFNALDAYNAVLADSEADETSLNDAHKGIASLFTATVRAAREAAKLGQAEQAWRLLEILSRHSDKASKIEREQKIIVRQLRGKINSIEAVDQAARLSVANTLLRLEPDDLKVRRLAAGSAMRLRKFAEAREHWRNIAEHSGITTEIEAAIAKCDLWIARAPAKNSLRGTVSA